ncbi:MAG: hypothetical protein SFY66_22170 [Oculatellaceae cyanobacterium bins.114]|nr:hypothetical protein [Oculatellaceae cyanobacterium bins.114]
MVDDEVFTVLQLSEEINQKLEVTAPLIVFFGMLTKEQIAVLPVLEERLYDFPEGDWITSNALEVLVHAYNARLNSISIRFTTLQHMQDELGNKSIKDLVDENLVDLIEQLVSITHKITEGPFEIIDNADIVRTIEWKSLRQLSSAVQRKLEIQLTVNTEIVKNCVEQWLHP